MEGSIAFFFNTDKPGGLHVRDRLIATAEELGFTCFSIGPDEEPPDISSPLFVAAIGGDGTVLRSVPYAIFYDIPILGVNTGRIGFLSEVQPEGFVQALRMYKEQALLQEARMMLNCSVNGVHLGTCLNDVLLYKQSFSGVALINFFVNGDEAGTVYCDGMIIGTPTGSTGYSISAGGPIVAPGLDACVITPVCSHSLLARPIVAAADALLEFRMHSPGCLYADGQKLMDIGEDDRIEIKRAAQSVRFLRMNRHNLFGLIREKLI